MGGATRISVIIPLEYHRGLAVDCIRGWVSSQDYPRELYRVLIGAPADFDRGELQEVRTLLGGGDLLLELDQGHDMTLIEDVARHADTDLLLFSESHCIPEPDALSYLVGVAQERSDWAAFSAPTHGLTSNLLSRIECDIYSKDIRGKLQSHDWLRVLDQCFVIRREAYDAVGGFRGEFGHFAEWLFAATMKTQGLKLGVAERAVVKHGYIGEYDDLEAFTVDFAYGQIKYLYEHSEEPAATLFPSIPELDALLEQTKDEHIRLMSYPAKDKAQILWLGLRKILHRDPVGSLGPYLAWASKCRALSHSGSKERLEDAVKAASEAKAQLDQAIANEDSIAAHHLFVEWFSRLVQKGRYSYLAERHAVISKHTIVRPSDFARYGEWRAAGGFSPARVFGTHDAEGTEQGTIRWTLPCFQIILPLHAGEGRRVVLEWSTARPLNPTELVRIRLNGKNLPRSAISVQPTRLLIDVEVDVSGWHEIAVSVYPFQGAKDGRLFGLPLKLVNWLSVDQTVTREQPGDVSRYFLHVTKCGGTTAAILTANGYAADECFAPYSGAYEPADFLLHPWSAHRVPFYSGHFAWTIAAAFPPGDTRVATMLRHPIDRLLSMYHYFQQRNRINRGPSFEEWIRAEIRFQNTMVRHFIADTSDDEHTGAEAVSVRAKAALAEACKNLRQCVAVGLTEEMEDSVNLMAHELGFLPPEATGRFNATESRADISSVDPAFLAQLEEWFAPDFALYAEAQAIFKENRAALHAEILGNLPTPSTSQVRMELRQRYMKKLRAEADIQRESKEYRWTAMDVFHGENLHAREQDHEYILRWTAPGVATKFYLPIQRSGVWKLELELHPAMDSEKIDKCKLTMDGTLLPSLTHQKTEGRRITLATRVVFDKGLRDAGDVPELAIEVPVSRGRNEFREIGIPLLGIRLIPEV
ncbi:hypothetical protein GmRootA79_38910 [Acidovorax sp. A79]